MNSPQANVPSAVSPVGLGSFSVNNTFGAALLGTYFSLILYGGILHQAYRYYRVYLDDTVWLKTLVLVLVALESAQTALSIYACYYMLIIGYANITVLEHASLSENMLPVVSGAIIVLTQAFFVRRAYMSQYLFWRKGAMFTSVLVGRKYFRWAAVLVLAFLLSGFGFCVASTANSIISSQKGQGTFSFATDPWITGTSAAFSVAADIILTCILTISLHRSRTGIKSTNTLMDKLILYTVTNGLITSTCMIVLFIFVFVQPTSMVYVAMSFVSTKLYTNTLLAALNTRRSLRGKVSNPSGIEIFGSSGGVEQRRPLERPLRGENTVTLEFADIVTRSDGSKP